MEIKEMIRREMKRTHISKAELARKLNNNSSSVLNLLKCQTIQVDKLIQLSDVFQYNFFREIAATLPYKEPDYEVKVDVEAIKAPLQEQIKNLQLEVNILRQTIKDLVSR